MRLEDIALRLRDHLERVAENYAIMARSTSTTNVQLNTLMVGIRRLNNKSATSFTLLYNRRRVAFDRAFDQLTDQCMT